MKHARLITYRVILIVAGIAMLTFGIMRDEVSYVFHKAVNLCLECVGIG